MKVTGSLIVCTAAAAFTAVLLLINPDPSPTKPGAVSEYGETPTVDSTAEITILKFAFSSITVAPDAVVKVTNLDEFDHTASASDGSFDTKKLQGGATVEIVAPSKPGTYAFVCKIHPSMKGTLTVG